ncbi:unnamed protein product [Paramecium sonneborni]|uniref:Uncharacterized protein n=1 Tax=Paramecium sonneborni TaxID=65129 RepID=A0A8S1NFI6_9CILI|nr:unnamed protein product [Paramecium sonneborni]
MVRKFHSIDLQPQFLTQYIALSGHMYQHVFSVERVPCLLPQHLAQDPWHYKAETITFLIETLPFEELVINLLDPVMVVEFIVKLKVLMLAVVVQQNPREMLICYKLLIYIIFVLAPIVYQTQSRLFQFQENMRSYVIKYIEQLFVDKLFIEVADKNQEFKVIQLPSCDEQFIQFAGIFGSPIQLMNPSVSKLLNRFIDVNYELILTHMHVIS